MGVRTAVGITALLGVAVTVAGLVLALRSERPSEACVSVQDLSEQITCLSGVVTHLARTKGVAAALDEVGYMGSQPLLSRGCHAAAHVLGGVVYHMRKDGASVGFSPAMDTCSFGFFHGYIVETSRFEGEFASARTLCEEARDDGGAFYAHFPQGECYHGIGNAAYDLRDDRDDPAQALRATRDVCASLTSDDETYFRCMGGAYNSLGNDYKRGVLTRHEVSPGALCALIEDTTRALCEQYLWGSAFVRESVTDVVAQLPPGLSEVLRKDIVSTNLSLVAQESSVAPREAPLLCQSLPEAYREPCVTGYARGMTHIWDTTEAPSDILEFCASNDLAPDLRSACVTQTVRTLSGYMDAARLSALCSSAPPSVREVCAENATGLYGVLADPNIRGDYY